MILEVDSVENVVEVVKQTKCSPVATKDGFLISIETSSLMLYSDNLKTILYSQHLYPISTMCVSSSSVPIVCSCSDDRVMIWIGDDVFTNNAGADSKLCKGQVIGVDLGAIIDCSISSDNSRLALCRENDVWIVNLEHANGVLTAVSHHSTLETPGDTPSVCCFSPNIPHLLVTADDSSSFKVWNADEGRVVQRSAVGSSHCISFCEFVKQGPYQDHLLVGTNRGALHLYSIDFDKPPRDIRQVSAILPLHSSITINLELEDLNAEHVSKSVPLCVDYEPQHHMTGRTPGTPPGIGDGSEAGCVVLSALLVDPEPDSSGIPISLEDSRASPESTDILSPTEEDPTVKAIIAPAPLLIVCSNLGVVVYDCNSWECLTFRPYEDLLSESISLVSTATLSARSPGRVHCLLSGWSSNSAGRTGPSTYLVRFSYKRKPCPLDPPISFLARSSPSPRSPLRLHFSRPAVDTVAAAYGGKSTGSSRSSLPPAKPLVGPVRSSGYGFKPRAQRKMFVPVTNETPKTRSVGPAAGRRGEGGGGLLSRVDSDLMKTWTCPMQQSSKINLWPEFGTEVRLASSGDGLSLACSCGPGVLSVLRWSRPSVEDCVRIPGHDARITSICFSADSSLLLSASSDGKTKVWDWRRRRCALDIVGDPPSSGPAGRTAARAGVGPPGRGHAVTQVAFFYLDRFILRAVSNVVELYCHRLYDEPGWFSTNKAGVNDVRGWRRVRRIQFPTQQVMCFAAPNNFHSNILVAGCASRSLYVYDVDAERSLAEIRDAHPRPPYALGLATPSMTANSARAADLLVSAAACDGTKLWDLRQARCVQKFARHLNRAHTCSVALSPCCRFLASASEDKHVYLYDTRKSSDYLDKLQGLNEVVLDVVWNSSRPQLAASALNSCVSVYCNS